MNKLVSRPKAVTALLALTLAASGGVLASSPVQADQSTGTAQHRTARSASLAKSIWRPTGTVETLLTTRTRIYLGGNFTTMRSPAGKQVQRVRVAALDRATGRLVGFRARVNGPVRDMAVFKGRLYIGGDFTRVNHHRRLHLAALDLRTGRLVGGWRMQVDGPVLALLPMRGRLYVGGNFGQAAGVARDKLFALDKQGALVPGWPALDTGTNGGAYALAATPDRTAVIVGGAFRTLVGQPRTFLGAITTAGQTTAWAPAAVCASNCFVRDLIVGGKRVYAGIQGPGGHATAYRLSTGRTVWSVRASGDVSAMALSGRRLLIGGHFTRVNRKDHTMIAELRAGTGAVLKRSFRTSGKHYPGVLAIKLVGREALLGGAFEDITGQARLAVVRP